MRRLLFGVVSGMTLAGMMAMAAPAPTVQGAADDPASVLPKLLKGKSAQDAATIVGDVMKAVVAKGGTESELKKRLEEVVGAAIGAAGDNAAAVAGALIGAAGDKNLSTVAAAIGAAATKVAKDDAAAKAIVEAAAKAGGEANEKAIRDACAKPAEVLGGLGMRRVVRVAERSKAFIDGRRLRRSTTTTTTTTTTTIPPKDANAEKKVVTTVVVPTPTKTKPKPKPEEPEKPTPTPVGKR